MAHISVIWQCVFDRYLSFVVDRMLVSLMSALKVLSECWKRQHLLAVFGETGNLATWAGCTMISTFLSCWTLHLTTVIHAGILKIHLRDHLLLVPVRQVVNS
jgi:hypothetical protein